MPAFDREKMYGRRARIGYTSPPLTTEIFPYEFYKIVPDGVTPEESTQIQVASGNSVSNSQEVAVTRAVQKDAEKKALTMAAKMVLEERKKLGGK